MRTKKHLVCSACHGTKRNPAEEGGPCPRCGGRGYTRAVKTTHILKVTKKPKNVVTGKPLKPIKPSKQRKKDPRLRPLDQLKEAGYI